MGTARLLFIMTLALIALVSGIHSAHADQVGYDYQALIARINQLQVGNQLNLQPLYVRGSLEPQRLTPEVIRALGDVATSQAQIWSDTILEGDFEADGRTRLDRIDVAYSGDQLVAYRITYSERAWFIGDCNTRRDPARKSCQEGRISEATYVSPGFSSWFRDDQAYANFQ